MRTNRQLQFVSTGVVLLTLLLFACPGYAPAGELEPSAPPSSTMKTLDEVEPRMPISNLPFTISQPGSYYLTGNLSSTITGITINADNVTIDLMGYTMSGGTGNGISMDGRSNVEISNGTVRGFTENGIYEGNADGVGHRVIRVRAVANGSSGIYLRSRANLVQNCTATGNGGSGIHLSHVSEVSHNTVYDNDTYGIYTQAACSVSYNTVYDNQNTGIYVYVGSVVSYNSTTENGSYGIYAYSGSTVSHNTAYNNGSDGIYVYRSVVTDNTADSNGGNGIFAHTGSMAINNIADYNSGIGIIVGSGTAKNNTARGNQQHGIQIAEGLADGNTATYNNRETGGSYENLYCSRCTLGTNHAP